MENPFTHCFLKKDTNVIAEVRDPVRVVVEIKVVLFNRCAHRDFISGTQNSNHYQSQVIHFLVSLETRRRRRFDCIVVFEVEGI